MLKVERQRKLKKELDAERVRTKELEEKLNNLKALNSQTETAPDRWTGYSDGGAQVQQDTKLNLHATNLYATN